MWQRSSGWRHLSVWGLRTVLGLLIQIVGESLRSTWSFCLTTQSSLMGLSCTHAAAVTEVTQGWSSKLKVVSITLRPACFFFFFWALLLIQDCDWRNSHFIKSWKSVQLASGRICCPYPSHNTVQHKCQSKSSSNIYLSKSSDLEWELWMEDQLPRCWSRSGFELHKFQSRLWLFSDNTGDINGFVLDTQTGIYRGDAGNPAPGGVEITNNNVVPQFEPFYSDRIQIKETAISLRAATWGTCPPIR